MEKKNFAKLKSSFSSLVGFGSGAVSFPSYLKSNEGFGGLEKKM